MQSTDLAFHKSLVLYPKRKQEWLHYHFVFSKFLVYLTWRLLHILMEVYVGFLNSQGT